MSIKITRSNNRYPRSKLLLGLTLVALSGAIVLGAPYVRAQKKMNPLQAEAMRLNWAIVTASGLPNSPELISQFDRAATLARQENYPDSLSAWNKLLSPASKGSKLIATSEFLGQCYIRKAYVLMDMHKYSEAKNTMLHPVAVECLSNFTREDKAMYHFSLANIMGHLKDQAALEKEMMQAIEIYKSLKQGKMLQQCYSNMLTFARVYGWKSFEQKILKEAQNL